MEAKEDCGLLIASCDTYDDLWTPFFNLLRRQWPDVPFPVYLGAGERSFLAKGVTTLHSDGGWDWSQCMIDYLDRLEHRYVLVMLDDFFLRGRVETDKVLHCLDFARLNNAVQVRLVRRPGPTQRVPGERVVGECAVALRYRLSTQAAIWDRLAFRSLLRRGENIWEFEHNGNLRASTQPHGFYSVWRSVLPYEGIGAHHVIEKGKWLVHEKWIFGRMEIGCDFARRGSLSLSELVLYQAAQALDLAIAWLPWRAKQCLKRCLKAALAPLMRDRFHRMGGIGPPRLPPGF
jgi:hypothetical protein